MKKNNARRFLLVIMILSILGFFVSLYLIKNHYAQTAEGALCDLGETVSCSLVNTSIYSELFGIPVALLGAIWFFFLFMMARKVLEKDDIIPLIFIWSIFGFLFAIYMVIAEIILRAICPFCTVIHVIVLMVLVLSYIIYKKQGMKINAKPLIKAAKPWIVWMVIFNLIPLIVFNLPESEKRNYDDFAKCLSENGIKMYGSITCSVCKKQREAFGASFQYINEIECHPRGKNPQTELCLEKNIRKTPTWVIEDGGIETERLEGFQSFETLAKISGCHLNA